MGTIIYTEDKKLLEKVVEKKYEVMDSEGKRLIRIERITKHYYDDPDPRHNPIITTTIRYY